MILSGAIRNASGQTEVTFERAFRDILGHISGDEINPDNAEKLGAAAAAHRIYTNAFACMPWQIRQRRGAERVELDHPLSTPLKVRMNRYMSPYVGMKTYISYAFWHGASYMWIIRGRSGEVTELIPLLTDPEIRINPADGVRWYEFTLPEDNLAGVKLKRRLSESELLVFRFESFDGIYGKGLLSMAGGVIDSDLRAQKYNAKFYANGARPSGVLEIAGDISDENREKAQLNWQEKYSGENAFKIAVLDNGMKYTPLGLSQAEQQYIEQRKFTVEELSRYTGIPEYMLQTGKQSYQSNEQQELDFLKSTLIPPVTQLEQEWGYKLFPSTELASGCYLKLNTTSRLRGTDKERAEFYDKMIGLGIMNQDETRALEDRSPLPDGQGSKYWMSKNYAPIDMPGAFMKPGGGAGGGSE